MEQEMKRGIITVALIIICFLLQCTVFRVFAFGGIVPNLLIIITASFGFMRGEKTGLLIGFLSGLLVDIFFGEIIGLHSLIYIYIGYCNGKFNSIFYPEDIKLPLALIFISDLIYGIIFYALMFMMRGKFDFSYYFMNIILPEVVYTIFVTMLLYPLVLWINNKLENKEKGSVKKFV